MGKSNGETETALPSTRDLVKRWNTCNVFVPSYKNTENMFSNSFKKFCDDSSSAWIQRLYSAGKRESSGNRLGNGRMREGGGKERRYERTWKRGILATSNGIGLYRNQEREQKETGGGGADTRGSLVTRE